MRSPSLRHRALLAEASDPQTPPERLRGLADVRYRDVLAAVARNPSTPFDALSELVLQCPAQVLGNATWMMAALADPSLQATSRLALAQCSADASELLALARDPDPQVQRVVASNSATPAEALWVLARNEEPMLWLQVAGHHAAPPELLTFLMDRLRAVRRAQAASSKNPAPGAQPSLDLDDPVFILAIEILPSKLAAHRNAPARLLTQLMREGETIVRQTLASNPSTPPAILAELALDRSTTIRRRVANNPSSGESILLQLACDRDVSVRAAVARHPRAPLAALRHLAAGKRDRAGLAASEALRSRAEPAPARSRGRNGLHSPPCRLLPPRITVACWPRQAAHRPRPRG